ncbi:FixH family protein [Cytobacillus firmus]|uniref:FixH family protein n=1 Tax=Cytobacillus firmus TaxID=1399 RepID=UPI002E20FE7C|nr:FixH family protein [Cytobacillus firmus]
MKKSIMFLLLFLILAGCSNKNEIQSRENIREIIVVSVETVPKEVKQNEEILIQAKITQGKEVVTDADDMKFEIWKEGVPSEEHEEIKGELNKEEGTYFVKKTFNEPGLYYVIAHVTARGMHNMPQVEIEVPE